MKKPLKYLALGAAGLLVLAGAGLAVFALTFDPNRYKPQIEQLAKERTGRTLRLQGDLEVAFFPSLGAKINGVTLSERGSDQQFVALESAHVSVKVLPLLRGQAVVDAVRIAGLKAQVIKDKEGRFNFADLLEGEAGKPAKPAPEPQKGEGGPPVAFDIASVHIERSALSYRDLASGQDFAIDGLELSTGRLAERADGRLSLSAQARGRNPDLDARLAVGGEYQLDLPAKSYGVKGLDLTISGSLGKEPLNVKLAVPQVQLAPDALSVPKLDAELSMSAPNLPQKNIKVPLSGSLRADLEKKNAAAELSSKFDESTIQARLGLARFSPPAYTFDINVDRLDLDRYLPPEKPAAGQEAGKQAPAEGKPTPGKAEKAGETPVDLSALKGLDANGRLQLGALQVRGLKLANLKAEVKAANGRLDLPHSASLYEGSVSGALGLQADGNRVSLKDSLSGVAVGPLLRDFAQKDILEGRGNLALDVTMAGPTVEAMKKALAGSAKVNLRDGAIKGINLAEVLRKVKTALGSDAAQAAAGKEERTDFSELSASFVIKNGVAHNEDLDVKAPLFRITGRGDIDIGNGRLDYVTKASVVATTKGQGGADLAQLAGVTVPVRLHGPFDALKYDVDYRAAAADLAKTRVGGQVKERIEQNRDKVEERVKDRLKGLLGR